MSKWLSAGAAAAHRARAGAVVTHVVSQPAGRVAATRPAPAHEPRGIFGPLSVLGWGPPNRAA